MKLHDVTVTDLVAQLNAGRIDEVVEILSEDHPGLTAVLLVQGRLDGLLTDAQCNEIANRLLDERVERFNEALGSIDPGAHW